MGDIGCTGSLAKGRAIAYPSFNDRMGLRPVLEGLSVRLQGQINKPKLNLGCPARIHEPYSNRKADLPGMMLRLSLLHDSSHRQPHS
jgi:hypothetical protein